MTGTDLVDVFAGLTLALAALTGLTRSPCSRGLRPRCACSPASLVALSYLAAAYLAQGAFKEPMMALFAARLVAWLEAWRGRSCAPSCAVARDRRRGRSSPIASRACSGSRPSLAAVALARYLTAEPRLTLPEDWLRQARPPGRDRGPRLGRRDRGDEWDRIPKFTRLDALNPDRFGSQLGNLAQSLSRSRCSGSGRPATSDAT